MSAIVNARDVLLQATSPRMITVALPSNVTVAEVSGSNYSLGPSGLELGTTNAITIATNGDLVAPNLTITSGVTTLTDAIVSAPVFDAFTVTGLSNIISSTSNGAQSYGSDTAVPSGGRSPYTYAWTAERWYGGTLVISDTNTATVSITGTATDDWVQGTVTCVVTDTNGLTATGTIYIEMEHGTAGPLP